MADAGIWIDIDPVEVMNAIVIGMTRQLLSIEQKRRDKVVAPPDPWRNNVESSGAELAVAKYTGQYWTGAAGTRPGIRSADVGSSLEVRYTPYNQGQLIVRPGDPDDRFFVLVGGTLPRYLLRGFIWGWTAKQERYKKDPRGNGIAYFVPSQDLRPVTELQGALILDDVPF